jgi:multicomponent Na+:H+ antiporter subunit G
MTIINLIGISVSYFGLFAAIISVLGVMFYGKDPYQKMHCAGINDSFGMPLMLIGVAILSTNIFASFKLVITIFFLLITCATSAHCICTLYYKEQRNNSEIEIKK